MTDLNRRAFAGLLFLVIALAVFLFLPGRTLDYWQAWLFLGVFSASVLAITVYLMRNDPALLERRVEAGPGAERDARQKVIQALASVAFVSLFVLSSVDHRFRLSAVPPAVVLAGDALVVLGLYLVFLVFRENSFTSATIAVEQEQKLVSTGPYARVRHPMYAGALVMLLGVPLALGSWWGLLALVPMVLVIVWRLVEEERLLMRELPGYAAYRETVRYRLVPYVW